MLLKPEGLLYFVYRAFLFNPDLLLSPDHILTMLSILIVLSFSFVAL
jgi:hypothetical protein